MYIIYIWNLSPVYTREVHTSTSSTPTCPQTFNQRDCNTWIFQIKNGDQHMTPEKVKGRQRWRKSETQPFGGGSFKEKTAAPVREVSDGGRWWSRCLPAAVEFGGGRGGFKAWISAKQRRHRRRSVDPRWRSSQRNAGPAETHFAPPFSATQSSKPPLDFHAMTGNYNNNNNKKNLWPLFL